MMRYRIGELVEIIDGDRGANYPKQDEFFDEGYCLFLNTGNVTKNGFSFSSNQFITQEKDSKLRKGKLTRNDIVYTTRGTVGNAAFYSPSVEFENVRINSGMIIIRKKDEAIDQKYLYQALKFDTYRNIFLQHCSGSAQPQLPIKTFSKIKIDIPDISTQEKIADILSTYDELIENNNKRIKLLEQMAENLYKEWFVRFRFPGYETAEFENGIPKGWEIKKLADYGRVKTGETPSTEVADNYGEEYMFVKTPDMHGNVFTIQTGEYLSKRGHSTQPKKLLPPDSIMVSCIGTGGVVSINAEPAHTNQQINSIILHDGDFLEWLFFICKSLKETILLFGATGATMTNLSKGKFEKLKVIAPKKDLVLMFHNQTSPIFSEIKTLMKQNQNLIKQRDLLLPRLMSGKLEV